jgi:ubiquinone/menaquinone biosynthesis C-methylase UbiE
MSFPVFSARLQTEKLVQTLVRSAILLLLIARGAFGQPTQPLSEADRVADMKQRVVQILHLRAGDTAADVGCGDGFYTIPLARFLGPAGKVFAVDINDSELLKLKQHLDEEGLKNVEVIKGAVDDPKLPADRVDAALIANAYHEMPAHEVMLHHIRAALKHGGVIVVMERISEKRQKESRDEQIKHHELAPQVVRQEVAAAGFEIMEVLDPFLGRLTDDEGKSRWWALVARKPTP